SLARILAVLKRDTVIQKASVLLGVAVLYGTPAHAADQELIISGLSACPDGSVVGLHKDGSVIRFAAATPLEWRRVGAVAPYLSAIELSCGTVAGKTTAFIVGMVIGSVRVVRMDLASGKWQDANVTPGTSAAIAYDEESGGVFVASTQERKIYRV